MNAADWSARLERHLPEGRRELLRKVSRVAESSGLPLYSVGGFVRDLLLGLTPRDFDFVVDGDAASLAHALRRELGGKVTVHMPFKTAAWLYEDTVIDFATARTETYPQPAALPAVTPAHISDDLRRRDFTINAMALRVDGAHFGEFLDPHAGRTDLAARVVRVLHPGSFLDDPTRIFRAARYAERLGFRLAPETLDLIPDAWGALDALTGDRLRRELELIFREPGAAMMLTRLHDLEVLQHIHPALVWDARAAHRAEANGRVPVVDWHLASPPEPEAAYLALMLEHASDADRLAALSRLNVTQAIHAAVAQAHSIHVGWPRPSAVVQALEALTELAIVTAWVLYDAHPQLYTYLAQWRFVRAETTGDDLIALGLSPGPRFKEILWKLRAARLDGEISDVEGERACVRDWLKNDKAA